MNKGNDGQVYSLLEACIINYDYCGIDTHTNATVWKYHHKWLVIKYRSKDYVQVSPQLIVDELMHGLELAYKFHRICTV